MSAQKPFVFTPLCSVDVGETLGLYHAIQWILELQLTNVDFEVNSNKAADYFNRCKGDITEFTSEGRGGPWRPWSPLYF